VRLRPHCAVVLFLTWAGALGATQVPEDAYHDGSRLVPLRRSATEIAVRFESADRQAHERLLRDLDRTATLTSEIRNGGRLFYVVSLQGTAPDAVARLVSRLRVEMTVAFVGPVFHDPATRVRMIPTDEIVVRLAPGRGAHDLQDVARAMQLTIVGALTGASSEYVLRLSDAKSGRTLEVARGLVASGVFAWVQPDFLRELQRGAV